MFPQISIQILPPLSLSLLQSNGYPPLSLSTVQFLSRSLSLSFVLSAIDPHFILKNEEFHDAEKPNYERE